MDLLKNEFLQNDLKYLVFITRLQHKLCEDVNALERIVKLSEELEIDTKEDYPHFLNIINDIKRQIETGIIDTVYELKYEIPEDSEDCEECEELE